MANSYLGTGWSFPPQFDNQTNSVVMTSDELDIQRSLQILLTTRKGERVMLPDYGCNLDEMLFEPMNTMFKTQIAELIRNAVLFYEARIDLKNITIDDSKDSEGVILVILDYIVRTTNSRFNFVYPYYKTEGTEIQ